MNTGITLAAFALVGCLTAASAARADDDTCVPTFTVSGEHVHFSCEDAIFRARGFSVAAHGYGTPGPRAGW